MDYLGYIQSKPSIGKSGKWNYLDVKFNTAEEFNEATAKIMNILYKHDSTGECAVLDGKGNTYLLEIIHSTFNTSKNSIRVFPHECKFEELKPKTNNTNERKQNAVPGATK